MKNTYNLRIDFQPMSDTNGRTKFDCDWYFFKEYKSKYSLNSARKQASKLSLKEDVYQVEIHLRSDDDPIIQEWWKDGKLEFKMF